MTFSPVIFGEVLFDIFPDGKTVLGGAPFNVAWHLQAFGTDPILISKIGDDANGDKLRKAMIQWGMTTKGLQTDPNLNTGIVQITMQEEEPCYDICHPSAYDAISAKDFPALTSVPVLYHGSLALRTGNNRTSFSALRKKCRAPVFIDVNLRAPWWSKSQILNMIADANWVKLNADELSKITEHPDFDPADQAINLIGLYDLDGVILTMGEDGAMIITASDTISAAPPKATTLIDTVGAGDAFSAVFLYGFLKGWNMTISLDRAQEFAAEIVGQRGATTSDSALYAQFLEKWEQK